MDLSPHTALVLFSGGQDSTVCLAWALQRFARVEAVGGQPLLDLVIEETHSCYRGDRAHRHDWG